MATGINVLRYSALGYGVFYGFTHQRTIYSDEHKASEKKNWQQKEDLITRAKAEYLKKFPPKVQSDGSVVSNPEDPKFDFEAWANAASSGQT